MHRQDDVQNVSDGLSLMDFDSLFHQRLRRTRTPITSAFFKYDNLNLLNNQIAAEVGRLLHTNRMEIIPTVEYFQYLTDLADSTPNLENIHQTVWSMNQQVTSHEVPIHYNSVRRREIFLKWFIHKDRPRVMDRPVGTYGRHRFTPLTAEKYATEDPMGKGFQAYEDFRQNQNQNQAHSHRPHIFQRYYR